MILLPFFRQDKGSGTKPPDNNGRSSHVASSAMGRHRIGKLTTALILLAMSASAVSQDVMQYPKRPDLLEQVELFDTKPGAQKARNFDSDGGNMMKVSTCKGMYCIIEIGRMAGTDAALRG
jgi:hypothetical protein